MMTANKLLRSLYESARTGPGLVLILGTLTQPDSLRGRYTTSQNLTVAFLQGHNSVGFSHGERRNSSTSLLIIAPA